MRATAGWFALLALAANLYAIAMFHRSEALRGQLEEERRGRAEREGEVGRLRGQVREIDGLRGRIQKMSDEMRNKRDLEMKRLKERVESLQKDIDEGKNGDDDWLVQNEGRAAAQLDAAYEANSVLEARLASLTGNGTSISPNLRGTGEIQQNNEEEKEAARSSPAWTTKPWPRPEGWEGLGFFDIREHFHCIAYAHDGDKPLPTPEDWENFRKKYKELVDPAVEFDDAVPPTEGYTLVAGKEGPPPFYSKISADGRGRGLFASRDIRKGELVHNGDQSDVTFPDGKSWRQYIFSLPRKKACDVIDWTWTQTTEKGGKFRVFVAMNISVLFNSGEGDEANVNPMEDTSKRFYATRDIKKDEELLTDYSIYPTEWELVGL